ncbi:MAG: hypothetical protein HN742_26610 [Lentisphaerae bacterium]|nr:hypothetical protein [Lentisphaerota bacterium]MBT4822498.1 hypothetical protein [Lentisphaerota bacterium]MBT5606036.1 hypothetical protein [Lentisphaerota bacterium]MBT7058575.1 hypothetical protein [Lentisphaerota bacterium]MBT7845475.1 hypothetical protein [Lentisphaerota bacterium]
MTAINDNAGGSAASSARELGLSPESLWQAADKLRGSIDAAESERLEARINANLEGLGYGV